MIEKMIMKTHKCVCPRISKKGASIRLRQQVLCTGVRGKVRTLVQILGTFRLLDLPSSVATRSRYLGLRDGFMEWSSVGFS